MPEPRPAGAVDVGTDPSRSRPALRAEEVRRYCLAKPGAWRDQPWEGDVVAKVHDKIFAFLGGDSVGVKCGAGREEADEWLLRYPEDASVMAYIGRSGWNTLKIGSGIPDDEIREAIDTSYELVVSKLPKKYRPEGWDAVTGQG
jgi:predicted DNA-binding protein (MmcQ/YjbR family)